jgi:cytosine/uracil/thiamine/allantoin permease
MGFGSIRKVIAHNTGGRIEFAAIWFLVLILGFASVYSLLRPNFLRVPLISAGMVILLLWLLAAALRAALEGSLLDADTQSR